MPETRPENSRPPLRHRRWWFAVAVLLVLATLSLVDLRTRFELYMGRRSLTALEFNDANRWAETVLARHPESTEGLLLAARATAQLRDHLRALDLLKQIPDDGTVTAVEARLEAGDLLMERLHHLSAAEAQFRRALAQGPENQIANDRLAYLLSVASRHWDAIAARIKICQQDDFNPLHLKILAVGEGSIVEPQIVWRFHEASPDDAGPLISLAWLALTDGDLDGAEELLQEAVSVRPELSEAQSLLAETLLQSEHGSGFLTWHAALPKSTLTHPGIWTARGRWARRQGQLQIAARCFWEAVRRNPNHQQANYQLGQVLARLNRQADAVPFLERSHTLNQYSTRVTAAWISQELDDLKTAVDLAETLGLIWEAYGWAHWARPKDDSLTWPRQVLNRLEPRLASLEPTRSIASANPARTVDLGDYPLPDWEPSAPARATLPTTVDTQVQFHDRAVQTGLDFQYHNGSRQDQAGTSHMFEMTGGGAAVLDFDGDGWPDIYLPQGGNFSRRGKQTRQLDQLFHNLGGTGFANVTGQSGLVGNGFGQGATVGDFNADGFPDLYVANIGANQMFRNNGDGTFTDISVHTTATGDRWTTSCLMVDLNNDHLPDLYAVNFLSGDDVFTRACKRLRGPDDAQVAGSRATLQPDRMRAGDCSPLDFPSAQDQFYLNTGDGGFREVTQESGIEIPRGNGLGIVAADFDGSGQINLFLANDSVPNFFFVREGSDNMGIPRFRERAFPLGLAVNRNGSSEACMGVAAGDADGDGRIDLYITNFQNQSSTLYRKLAELNFFADGTQRAGLRENSLSLVGFGTQFVDADLDGDLDLLVTNGHVEDSTEQAAPYRMPPQYLHNLGGGHFVELEPRQVGEFFSKRFLGRGLARLDWNRDGRDDVLISHMDAPAALLTNTSPRSGHHVALRLRATTTARDAIATRVTLQVGSRTLQRQLTAGDGYMASNQRQLIFGLGRAEAVGPLVVYWPSGHVDRFADVPRNCDLILLEASGQLTRIPR